MTRSIDSLRSDPRAIASLLLLVGYDEEEIVRTVANQCGLAHSEAREIVVAERGDA